MRQLMVLIVTALLMPASALLPTLTARMAGSAGWLSMAGSAVLLLAAGRVAQARFSAGYALNRPVTIIYMVWTLLLLAVSLRLSGARLTEIYGERMAWICALAVLVLAAWMARGKLAAMARAAEIFYLALAVALASVLLLAVFRVEWANYRLEAAQAAGLPESSLAAAGLLLNLYPAAVLLRRTQPEKGSGQRAARWLLALCAALGLLLAAVTGCLGAALTGKIASPFLIMVQGLGVQGAFQRAEALIVSLWTLSDLALVGLLLYTWRELAQSLRAGTWSRWSVFCAGAAAMGGGWLAFGDVEVLWWFCSEVLPVLGLILGLLCPALGLLAGKWRARHKRE